MFLLIFSVVEIGNLALITRNRNRINSLTYETIDKYIYYWEKQFSSINKSLNSIQPHENGKDFENLLNSQNTMNVELSKVEMQNLLINMGEQYGDQYYIFLTVPERNIYVRSDISGFKDEDGTDQTARNAVLDYIETKGGTEQIKNDVMWDTLSVGGEYCFIKVYSYKNGYVGAAIHADDLLIGLSDDTYIRGVNLQRSDGNILCGTVPKGKLTSVFSIDVDYTDAVLNVYFSDGLVPFNLLVFIVALVAFAFSAMAVQFNIKLQSRRVFSPLEELRSAMIEFSGGNLDVHLSENNVSDPGQEEIRKLFCTFNNMTSQIKALKIQVYDEQLQKEKIMNNYLKLQIQPHFYANVLNLIYGFAQIHDDVSIQKIAMATAAYFRYLLAEKSTFMPLSSELDCVKNFAEVQNIRYGDILEFHYEIADDVKNQLIVPLIIYTFVENSVKSNVTLRPSLHITIRAVRNQDRLQIMVLDDGVGMSKEMVDKINAGINLEKDGKHIGIDNLRQRLKMAYGENFTMQFHTTDGKTEVFVDIPVVA